VENQPNHSPSIALLTELIQRPSVTPDDAGCQQFIAERLKKIGFHIEPMRFGDVDNLWARLGSTGPLFVFAGHTDVVPVGDETAWTHLPFGADIKDGMLYGRGAADMKGSVAAFVTAIERFVAFNRPINGSIALLLTSDEEGPAINGTKKVIEALDARNEHIDYCVVGEPTSTERLGDTIKNGRRGSLSARLSVHGKQGHVAYPHLADNPVHKSLAMLDELVAVIWDAGDQHFPPTTLQISNIQAGTGAGNVIPGSLTIDFNLRYSPATSIDKIKMVVADLVHKHHLDTNIDWHDSAHPFLTPAGSLTDALTQAIAKCTSVNTKLDTGGGTSDGRFIAPYCNEVVEFGPLNNTIHAINECISCDDIDTLSAIYEKLLESLLINQEN